MSGSSSVRGDQTIYHTDNMCFDGTDRGAPMAADGQLWIGATASNRADNGGHVRLGNLTAGTGVSITNGPGTITIGLAGGGTAIDSITPNSGTSPVVPDGAGNVSILGTGSITTVGSLNTETIQLTGLTNHAVLVGAGTPTITSLTVGTDGQVLGGNTAADPAFTTTLTVNGEFLFTTPASGAGATFRQVRIETLDNTNGNRNAALFVQTGGTSGGAPFICFNKGTARSWAIGASNLTNEQLVIHTNNTSDVSPTTGTETWNMTIAGERTMPLQPAFSSYLESSIADVTGAGTNFTLGTTTALTEIFDQGSDFNTNGTFTAPITGRYRLGGGAYLTGCTIATTMFIVFTTSNRGYQSDNFRPASPLDFSHTMDIFADMDAGDTAVCKIGTAGEAGDTNDLLGGANVTTYFNGQLEV